MAHCHDCHSWRRNLSRPHCCSQYWERSGTTPPNCQGVPSLFKPLRFNGRKQATTFALYAWLLAQGCGGQGESQRAHTIRIALVGPHFCGNIPISVHQQWCLHFLLPCKHDSRNWDDTSALCEAQAKNAHWTWDYSLKNRVYLLPSPKVLQSNAPPCPHAQHWQDRW